MAEAECAVCGRRSVLEILSVVGCFHCGANAWEAAPGVEPMYEDADD